MLIVKNLTKRKSIENNITLPIIILYRETIGDKVIFFSSFSCIFILLVHSRQYQELGKQFNGLIVFSYMEYKNHCFQFFSIVVIPFECGFQCSLNIPCALYISQLPFQLNQDPESSFRQLLVNRMYSCHFWVKTVKSQYVSVISFFPC